MSKTGKKAELDKDGISLPEKKAATSNKVELDQDGINLPEEKVEPEQSENLPSPPAPPTEAQPAVAVEVKEKLLRVLKGLSRRQKIILSAAVGVFILVILFVTGGVLWHKAAHKARAPERLASQLPPRAPAIVNPGEIVLEPFVILYTPQKQGKVGLLIAEITLTVNPKTAPNVKDKLYEIRALITEYLTKNVLVYTPFEIGEMLKEGLRKYDVADVTFTRYDLR